MNRSYRGREDYIERIRQSTEYLSGEWFRPQRLTHTLNEAGFKTITSHMATMCNSMVEDGILELYELWEGQSMKKMYRRKVDNRKYLTMPWRKHSNEQLEVSQCCLFPA